MSVSIEIKRLGQNERYKNGKKEENEFLTHLERNSVVRELGSYGKVKSMRDFVLLSLCSLFCFVLFKKEERKNIH